MSKLVNASNGFVVANNIEFANTFLKRFMGLMFKKSLSSDYALIFNQCNSIHTCFMKFNLDIIFLDKNYVVLHKIQNIKPWRFSKIISNSHFVIELLADSSVSSNIFIGNKLALKD